MHQVGTLIEGKYEVLAKIREGGMGTVYKVRHRLLDEIRIVKVMRQNVVGDPDLKRRFLEEAKTATRLKHTNICTIYDFALGDDGSAYLVMEFIDGVTLGDLIKAQGPLGLALSLEVAHQTLLALGYLHRRKVIHRDIAPDNVMLTHDEEGGVRIKLIDLGIAKVLDRQGEMTSTGVFLGKARYASPEQYGSLAQGETIDHRSDLYSMGLVFYEILTGQRAFHGNTPIELLRAHVLEAPIPFSDSDPKGSVPSELRTVVMKALEKKRENRYSSAEEFDQAIVTLKTRFAEAHPDAAEDIVTRARHLQEPSAADFVTPSAQDRLDREFLAQTTPLPSGPSRKEPRETVVDPQLREIRAREEVKQAEERRDLDGLEGVIREWPPESDIAGAASSAITRLRSLQAEEEEKRDWARSFADGSEGAWEKYLQQHPNSVRREEAQRLLGEARNFREAAKLDSREAWSAFLATWPEGRYRSEAKRRVEQAQEIEAEAFERAKSIASAKAYSDFLAEFPASSLAKEARSLLEEQTAFDKALAQDSRRSWEEYIVRWPSAPNTRIAKEHLQNAQRLEEQALQVALEEGSSKTLRKFLEENPDAATRPRAEQHLQEAIDFEEAGGGGLSGFEFFLKKHPKGRHAEEAKARLKRLKEEYAVLDAIREHEEAQKRDELQRLVTAYLPSTSIGSAARAALGRVEEAIRKKKLEQEKEEAARQRKLQQEKEEAARQKKLEQEREEAARRKKLEQEKEEAARQRKLRQEKEEAARQKLEQEKKDWSSALQAGTEGAWKEFLASHSDSPRAPEARRMLAEVQAREAEGRRKLEKESKDWETAQGAGSERAWKEFLASHPESSRGEAARRHLAEAQAREAALLRKVEAEKKAEKEKKDWERVSKLGTEGAWKGYLERNADSPRLEDARRLLAEAHRREEEERDWQRAQAAGSEDAWKKFLQSHSDSVRAETARRMLAEVLAKSRSAQEVPAAPISDTEKTRRLERPALLEAAAAAAAERAALRQPAVVAQRLTKEASAVERVSAPELLPKPAPSRYRTPLLAVAAALVVAIGVVWLTQGNQEKSKERSEAEETATSVSPVPPAEATKGPLIPAAQTGLLVIDALPWGRVDRLVDSEGKSFLEGASQFTPWSVRVPPGRYTAVVTNPNFPGRTLSLSAEVGADGKGLCSGKFEPVDARAYFETLGWKP